VGAEVRHRRSPLGSTIRHGARPWIRTVVRLCVARNRQGSRQITHVIVADRFSRKQIPRWADEGIAILSEPESKRLRRFRAYQNNVSRTPAFAASELMSIRDYPAAGRRDAFYWQSAALVSYLVQQKSPEEFLKFVDRALDSDAATALKEIYEIPSMARLQTHWQSWSGTFERTAPTLAERDAHRPSPQPLAN
jgi:hypothetical protein